MTQTVKLDILSDPICPWCYIGKTHLDKALANIPDHPLVIEWHPFQLNPDMPDEGMDRREYLERKFGGKEGAGRAYAPCGGTCRKRRPEHRFRRHETHPQHAGRPPPDPLGRD